MLQEKNIFSENATISEQYLFFFLIDTFIFCVCSNSPTQISPIQNSPKNSP